MNKVRNFMENCKKHPRLLLTAAILVSAVIVYYQYIFGSSIFMFNDIGSDTQQQYIMQYNTIVNHLRDGNFSFWDFNNGFGTSMFQLTIADPSLWVLYLLGAVFGPKSCAYLLIYLHMGKMILAGLAAYYFLSSFSLSKRSRCLAAYMYAFNGFLIVWGQHYQFSMVMVLLPCLLAVVEKAVQSRKFSLKLPLMTAAVVFYSYYTGYMSLILCGTYVIFRLIAMELSWKERFCQACKHALAMLLGVGMALVTLLPNYYLVSNVSSRLSSGMTVWQRLYSAFTKFPKGYYKTIVSRLFSSNLEGIGNGVSPYSGYGNYYEAPNVFFSTLFVILLIQFVILIPKISKKRKEMILWYAAGILAAATLTIMSFSVILNGFAYPISRHTFLMMPLFAYIAARSMDEILRAKCLNRVGIFLTGLLMIAFYLYGFRNASTTAAKLNNIILCGTGLLMIAVLVYAVYGKHGRMSVKGGTCMMLCLCALTGMNVICDSHITARHRSEVQKGSEEYFEYLYGDDIQELMEYVGQNDSDFYRMEKNYAQASLCMESCAQNYRGISTYNSTMNKNILEFVQKMFSELEYKNTAHLTYTQVTRDYAFANLFGIRYLISNHLDENNTGYHFVKQFGTLYLYESNQETSMGHLYTKTIDSSTYENLAMTVGNDRDTLVSQMAVIDKKDDLTVSSSKLQELERKAAPAIIDYTGLHTEGVSCSETESTISFNTAFCTIPLKQGVQTDTDGTTMEFDIQMNQTSNIFFTIDGNRNEYDLIANTPLRIALTIPRDAASIEIEVRVPNPEAVISGIHFWEQNINAEFTAKPIQVDAVKNDSLVTGTIQAEEKSLAVLTIPYEDGWTAELDGKPVELIRADYGFNAFYVEQGEHTFTLKYRQPMLLEGVAISIAFWVMYLGVCLLVIKSNKKK
ncbi:MAG: YfhO family protein [Lachnospiraceae bacterium]|nr:YfhO family protein [Lachnospiraceae bacterium]